MEIRTNRCDKCPQQDLKTEICCINEEIQCNFVLTFLDSRGNKYMIMRECREEFPYGVFFRGNSYIDESGWSWSDWRFMQQFEGKKNFDEAQEELNCLAIQRSWKPEIYSIEQIKTLKFFETDNTCQIYFGSPGGGRAFHPVIEKEEKEELQETEKDSFDI